MDKFGVKVTADNGWGTEDTLIFNLSDKEIKFKLIGENEFLTKDNLLKLYEESKK